jgi:hypothetical protein
MRYVRLCKARRKLGAVPAHATRFRVSNGSGTMEISNPHPQLAAPPCTRPFPPRVNIKHTSGALHHPRHCLVLGLRVNPWVPAWGPRPVAAVAAFRHHQRPPMPVPVPASLHPEHPVHISHLIHPTRPCIQMCTRHRPTCPSLRLKPYRRPSSRSCCRSARQRRPRSAKVRPG